MLDSLLTILWTLLQMVLVWFLLPIGAVIYLLLKLRNLFKWKTKSVKKPSVIVITGASSGIGQALAERYAEEGVILGLTARRAENLKAVKANCEKKGAKVVLGVLDVMDAKGMEEWLLKLDDESPVDLVVANAGVTVNTSKTHDSLQRATNVIFGTNVQGAFNSTMPLVPRMKERKSGQIAYMSSVSGYGPSRGMFAYCSSKACIKIFAEALRWLLYRDGVHVTALVPGFIHSPMTDANKDHMPLMMAMEPCIEKMVTGLSRDLPVVCTHWHFSLMAWILLQVIPDDFRDTIAKSGLSKLVAYHGKRRNLVKKRKE